MSGPGDKTPKPEFTDSDQDWFNALTGQPAPDAKATSAREGRALRTALEQRQHEMAASPELDAATSDDAMQLQLQRLRQRVKAEGVFDAAAPAVTQTVSPAGTPEPLPSKSNVIAFPWWRRRVALVGLAASVLAAVMVMQMMQTRSDYPHPPELMGADGLQKARAADPKQAAETLAARLQEAGLRPGLYQRGRVYLVDITLVAMQLPAAEASFAVLGLKPAPGFNRVEFAAP